MKSVLALSALTLFAFTYPTYAGTVTAHLDSVSSAGNVTLSFDGGHTSETSPYVGRIAWSSVSNSSGDNALNGQFYSYCIEGTQNVYIGQNSSWTVTTDLADAPDPLPAMGAINAGLVEDFWNLYYGSTASNTDFAAFQLGIWELRYDGLSGHDDPNGYFDSGTFRASNNTAALNLADLWLNDMFQAQPTDHYQFSVLTSPTLQDQLVDAPAAVPLPAALPMGLSLLGSAGLFRKLRRRA